MPETKCPVTDIIGKLRAAIDSGGLTDPRSRRRAEDILALLNDVAYGRADTEHLPTMESLARKLEEQGKTEPSKMPGNWCERRWRSIAKSLSAISIPITAHQEIVSDWPRRPVR
jgi:hypothetical protein